MSDDTPSDRVISELQRQFLQPLIDASEAETKAGAAIAVAELEYAERQLVRSHQIRLISAIAVGAGFLALIGTIVYLFIIGQTTVAMQLLQTLITVPAAYGFGRIHGRMDKPKRPAQEDEK